MRAISRAAQDQIEAVNNLARDRAYRGLYDVEVHGGHPSPKDIYMPKTRPVYRPRSGRRLMEAGIHVDLCGDYDSRIFHFKARGQRNTPSSETH